MPYVNNGDVRIHYAIEGDGPPVVLNHWSLGTLEGWRVNGFIDRLRADFTVIALDVRGHGKSDKPHDLAAYALENRVGDIVAILDELDIDRAHFYGYSMGGWIGYGMAAHAPERLRSLAIGGAHPYEQSMAGLREVLATGVSDGAQAFIDLMRTTDPEWTKTHASQWMDADFAAQYAVAQDRSSQEAILSTIECPCLILAGSEDGLCEDAERATAQIANARFVAIPGLDHGGALARSDLVAPILKEFLASVESDG
jgi:pimeloyl-ACP methyl ester carboxylesterase